jgi:formylmethanofuran dehydrogenase subunit E
MIKGKTVRQNLNQNKKEIDEIQIARVSIGLSLLKIGSRNCLACDELFETHDMKNQHICDICRMDKNIDKVAE